MASLATIEALRSQSFSNWEGLVGINGDLSPGLQDCSGSDSRLQIVAQESGEPVARLNELVDRCTGAYLAVLDAGDVLAVSALAELAETLARNPELDAVYSDEDVLGADSHRTSPLFKPAWSPELLAGFNYFGRLTAMRRSLVLALGSFSTTLGSASEWDMNLRIADSGGTVGRIPKVLCHRGATSLRDRPPPSDARSAPYRRALEAFWRRHGLNAGVTTEEHGTQRSAFAIDDWPMVSIIIPATNDAARLRASLAGVFKANGIPPQRSDRRHQ